MPAESIELRHHGATVPTLVYRPTGTGPHPAIVLAAEAYGINTFTRGVAEKLAAEGYVVVVPDYYRGHGLGAPDDYSDFTEVMGFIDALDFVGATRDILAGVDHARSLPEVDPERVAVWGYCTGGTLALLVGAFDGRLAATILFFPSQPTFPELTPTRPFHPIDALWGVRAPLLLIYGDQDQVAPAEVVAAYRERLERWGVDHEIRIYPGGGHAFSAPDPPLRHDASDKASWTDATAFAARVLQR
jgi:carboxymethylenebutenolidase